MQGILTDSLVTRAFDLVRPCIELTMRSGITSGEDLAVVVTATNDINPWTPEADGKSFEDSCYLVASIGKLERHTYPIAKIALRKAEQSVRTGLPTSKLAPQYLLGDDTLYWGSVVVDGIVVACSGLKPYHDEMFAYWIATAIQAEAKSRYEELLAGGGSFVE